LAIRGFRTKIAVHIFLLVLFSALATEVLALLVFQRMLVNNHLHHQRLAIQAIGWSALSGIVPADDSTAEQIAASTGEFFEQIRWPAAVLFGPDGRLLYARGSAEYTISQLNTAAENAFHKETSLQEHLGLEWAVFGWQAEAALIALPISHNGRTAGSIAAVIPLAPLYASLRWYNKPVYIFIIINTFIMCLVGLYRIFRIYLRPIDRIIRQADDYTQDDDIFFAFRQEDDELNRLSSALNRMIKRITEDKNKLRQTVLSLEKANEEIRRAQNEIIRAEKLASVGRLASGIAHEIGNPLGIVLGYLDLLKQPDLNRSERDDFVERSEKEIQRINTIIRQLLDLARPKESVYQEVSVHGLIAELQGIMALQPIMAGIQLKMEPDAADDRVWANADQLRQVFLNLMLNAADAIHAAGRNSGGCIRWATSCVEEQNPESPDYLIIACEDDGEGIEENRIANIFDPFYTTKDPGKGTGLGLAVSYMIIEKMGGAITVQSRPGQETTFTLRLPLHHRRSAGDGASTFEPQLADRTA
jgi:two-component system, NtrC family, sensor kinase